MGRPTFGGASYMGRPFTDPAKLFTTTHITSVPRDEKTGTCTTGGGEPVAERGAGANDPMVAVRARIADALLKSGWMFCEFVLGGGDPCDPSCEGCQEESSRMANAVIEALGIQPRAWVKHDGERVPYYVITWRPA